jgi:hypothetical protein
MGQFKQPEVQVRTATTTLTVTQTATETTTTSKTETKLARTPTNVNGDFFQGLDHWSADNHFGLPTTKWGYEIKAGEYGEIWIENPNDEKLDLVTLAQGPWTHPDIPRSSFDLRDHRFRLEAEVMVVADQILPYNNRSQSRVAIAFDFRRLDGSAYSPTFLFPYDVFSEFDVYQRNVTWTCEQTRKAGALTHHVDQLPFGLWRHYSIDVNDFFLNGFGDNSCGGWGKDWFDQSFINQWYLVVENMASMTKARIRNVRLYEI